MKNILMLIAIIAITGCSVDNSDNCNSLHNYTNDQTDANGLTLKASQDMHATFEQVSEYYGETMACMGMTGVGPEIRYVNFTEYFNGSVGQPFAFFTQGHIYMNTSVDEVQGITRDCRTDEEALKHEFVHHILWANGADWHHGDPMFAKCGIGVNTYN